jgi:signal transduction histidine kinase
LRSTEADSLIQVAYKLRDYERIVSLADLHQQTGALSDMKAYYWRGYAYSRLRKMRQAEVEWKQAVAHSIVNAEDIEYYSKSANRLAGLLYIKFDYEGTMRVAMPAIKLLDEKQYTQNTDYANLHTFMGNCQLKLGNTKDAAISYNEAYQCYLQVIDADDDITNYTSSIVGVITITDAYIQTGHFQNAFEWIDRFDSMLLRYRQHPMADDAYLDKQSARLNLYKACVLLGLNRNAEAERAYQMAERTQYAKTGDGQLESTKYLMAAHRWGEAADKFKVLEKQINRYDIRITFDIVTAYLLPKFRAEVGAHRQDSAISTGKWISNLLDSAIVWERKNDALELATIYDTQLKETEIMEQKASLSHQRFLTTVITLVLVVFGFVLFIFFRHRAARRLEIAYHHLEIANARAEESSRMKSNFIQQISHEIRTPLNILSGFTQVITSPDVQLDDEELSDVRRQIVENTNRITNLVNKMLELSDVKSQTVIEKNDTVSVMQIATDAVDISGIRLAAHLTFTVEESSDVKDITITTNCNAAVRALSLLLDNARKFTAPAESKQNHDIFVNKQQAVLRISLADCYVLFTVEDTGIGIPPSESEHVFEEFVQLDEYYNGTGIGLTVARSIARRLGGDIKLDNTYVSGARFVFSLPV